MDEDHELYRLADPQCHEAATIATAQDRPSTIARHEPAGGWRTTRMGDWPVRTGIRNMRHAASGSSGERVTIFPVDEQRFGRTRRSGPCPRRP